MLNICGHFHIAIVALALYWTIGSRTIKSHFLTIEKKERFLTVYDQIHNVATYLISKTFS